MDQSNLKGVVKLDSTAQFYQLSQGQTIGTENGLAKDKIYLVQQDNVYNSMYDLQAKVTPIGYNGFSNAEASVTLTRPVTDFECYVLIATSGTSDSHYYSMVCLPSMMYSWHDSARKILLKGTANRWVAVWWESDTELKTYGSSSFAGEITVLGVNL